MKTLKKDIRPITEQEWQKLTDKKGECSIQELASRVCKRIRDEFNLNDYAPEIAFGESQALVHSKVKSIDHEQMLLGGLQEAEEELKSGNTRCGEGLFVRNDKLTYKQLTSRFMQQFKHANASMVEAAKTQAILESEVGKMMENEPGLTYWDAVRRFRDQAGN